MNEGPSFWSDERIEELKTRFARFETATEIARALGHSSRNAIIGKLHRLGLTRADLPPLPPRKKRRRPPRLVLHINGHHREDPMGEETPPGFANPKPFIELGALDCHWPGPDRGHLMLCCAAPALDGYPYCAAHCRIAYTAPGARPKAP